MLSVRDLILEVNGVVLGAILFGLVWLALGSYLFLTTTIGRYVVLA